ncbi:histidine kinase [Opitutus terrae PB90-1]|uniref:histidine kinase n=2 Tax=Opitutus terrae TaxID=107709 RepID=B1ZXN3_OPITP|nr:histidine kinase [Opitutus terrae PB90-1]
MSSSFQRIRLERICLSLLTGCVWLALAPGAGLRGAEAALDPGGRSAITNAVSIWELTPAEKALRHPLQLEGRVSFVDPVWKNFWIEQNGVGTYLMLANAAPPLRAGQRVRLEGSIVPNLGLAADSVRVTVLQDFEPITPLDANGRIREMGVLASRIVTVDAYVANQLYVDADHIRLALIIEDRPVIGWVKPANPHAVPNWERKFVRLQALYSSRFNPTNTETSIELWCGGEENVSVLGSLTDSGVFDRACTPIAQLPQMPLGAEVLVRGVVEAHDAGAYLRMRDDTGQVLVRSIQPERIAFGAEVEAVGRVDCEGAKWVLRNALFRRTKVVPLLRNKSAGLDSVDGIRQLSLPQAASGLPVKISGLVTWSMPGTEFFYLQDVTGGIRVNFDPKTIEVPQLGKYLQVEGTTMVRGFMPSVRLAGIVDRGSMTHAEGRNVTFEQAITGKEDGQWVAIRGFIQRTESQGDWRWIYMTTPGGEVVGHLQSPVNFVANPGSLIRMQGVCEATGDSNGLLTGVMLRVPFIHSIVVEEDAPVDYYDLPVHSIKGLRRLSGTRELTRVRISAEVLHQVPGRAIVVQEEDVGLQLLSRQEQNLAPGDRIDAVGILGWEGGRIVLRETVCRKQGRGPAPRPVELTTPGQLAPALDARLVSITGQLIDVSQQSDHVRLTLQAGDTLVEATLDRDSAEPVDPQVGAKVRLTGIYRLDFDNARWFRRFTLQLRSPADIAVLQQPRLWTVQRALLAAGVLGGLALLGFGWITALRRRVHQQTRQIREQLERQTRLEAEVQRAARLESLGVLAGGIAHDFNNLLTIIIGNLGLALADGKLSESTIRFLREIERGATRARSLTRQLLTFAEGGEPLRLPIEAPEFVRAAAERALHGSAVRAEYVVPPGLWHVLADKDQIAQAIQNLVVNAIQAMPNGGALLVTFSNETIGAGDKNNLEHGRYVKITLADSGEGIRPEVLPRIFDPYFTTRRTGSGLGLATVYSILKRHAGSIEVDSRVGYGTTFTLRLPATDAVLPEAAGQPVTTAEPPTALTAMPAAATKGARVLLMDDEPSIQLVVVQVLQRIGVEVTAVADGAAALREFSLAQHQGKPFQLLLLDLTVPGGMGGREALELIRRLDPQVPAVVSSGYSNDPVMGNFRAHGFQAMVQKPYDAQRLAAVVQELLEQLPPGAAT